MSQQHPTNKPEREWDFHHLPTRGALGRLKTRRLRLRSAAEVIPIRLCQPDGTFVQSKSALIQLEVSVWESDKLTRREALEQFGKVMPDVVIGAVRGRVPVYAVEWFAPEGASFIDALRIQVNLGHLTDAMTGTPIEHRSKTDRRFIHAVTTTVDIPKDAKDPSQGTVPVTKVTHIIVGQFDRKSPDKGYEEGDRILILKPTGDGKAFAEILRVFLRWGLVQKITARLAEDHSEFASDLESKSVESLLEVALREAEHDDDRSDRDRRRPRRVEDREDREGAKKSESAPRAKNASPKYGWCVNTKTGETSDKPCAQHHKVVYIVGRQCPACGGELRVSKAQDFNQQMHDLEKGRLAVDPKAEPDKWAAERLQGFTPKAPAQPAPAPAPAPV